MDLPEHIKAASKVQPEATQAEGAGGIDTELTGITGVKTRYNEDVFVGNHTTVWGSFFSTESKKWGFKCCGSTQKSQVKCAIADAQKAPLLKTQQTAQAAAHDAQVVAAQ